MVVVVGGLEETFISFSLSLSFSVNLAFSLSQSDDLHQVRHKKKGVKALLS